MAVVLVMEPSKPSETLFLYSIISSLTVFSFPHCKTRLGFPRVHLPIVYRRYILHVFSYMISNMLALTIYLILFSFCLNLFCLALCTWLKGMRVTNGEKPSILGGNFYIFLLHCCLNKYFWQSPYHFKMSKCPIYLLLSP